MKHLKTLLLPAIAAVAPFMISSCDPKPAKGTLLDNIPNILTNVVGDSISQTCVKDSISVTSDFGHVGIAMQHPVDTFSVTSQAITEYMSEMLGGKYDGSYTSPKAVMKYYHADLMSQLKTEYEEVKRARGDDEVKMEWDVTFSKVADNSKFFTYKYTMYNYLGGAHGTSALFGVTFRKSDMRRMGWEIVRNYANDSFQELMRKGLREYFEVKSDDELKNMFLNPDNIYSLPLPECPPLFTDHGIMFVYNPYEIGPYAAGMPTFTIPYADIQPYLTTTAQKLIEKQ